MLKYIDDPTKTSYYLTMPTPLQRFCVASIMGFDSYDYTVKRKWHRLGMFVARQIGNELFGRGNFDVRSNKAGPAISGEVTLHSDTLYIQFDAMGCCSQLGFMYRRCYGRKDYTGGMNRWMKYDFLMENPAAALKLFRGASQGV